ncbi:hypothetical protein ASE23_08535 [Rhizobium sp. Root73]|nr:hypothetical protein ASC96_10945 [Rhizobium sp. Root1204]KQY05490.1 hypothetical protein ASD36_10765 [Rhizobium sp. Root1334]KRC01585.1 hypothetical protein ASE23_08535 [Rhizobium sp. Root73]
MRGETVSMNDVQVDHQPETVADFLASRGGPFYELQSRLGLLQERTLQVGRRAVIFIGLAWLVPLLLGLPHSLSFDAANGLPYLLDAGAWAKFFVAIGAFMLAEQQVEQRLRAKLQQVTVAPIVAPSSLSQAAQAVNQALKRRDSRVAEAVCLVNAIIAAGIALRHLLTVDTSSWAVAAAPGANSITLAGWWFVIVSMPLFWFLVMRGLWRHFVWSLLLRKLARLELRLVSTHPDGRAGLGFLGDYPNAYATFIFGMSCAVAAAVGQNLLHETASMTNITILMVSWLLIVLALFAFPLSAFSKPLSDLKKATLVVLGAQATQYHRLSERKLTGFNVVANNVAEAEQFQDVVDPSKQFDTTRKLSTLLMNRAAVIPVSAAALLPFAIVASTRVPFKDVFDLVKKLLLL